MGKTNTKIKTNFTIQQIDSVSGKIKKEEKVHNVVTTTGLNTVAKLIGGLSSLSFDYLAIGTDNTAETVSDTALGSEYTRENVTPTNATSKEIEYDNTFVAGTGVSQAITEAGLFNQATVSGSTMFNRATFSSFTWDASNSLRLIVTISVS